MPSERDQIEQAISAVEAQRPTLGDSATDAALVGLRERLAVLKASVSGLEQRKLVTVMFADVSGFGGLATTLDAEDMIEAMNAIWERLDAIIRDHGGSIDKHMGDAVMAFWGAPEAREDDPERAIMAALAMQAALNDPAGAQPKGKRLASAPKLALTMRIGINTGLALLGEVGSRGEFTAMGDAVNVASRLQSAAQPGKTLISANTYRHVRGVFDVTELDKLPVKGKSEPLEVYDVRGVKPRAFRIGTRGVEGVETRLVGRDAELERLKAVFHTVLTERRAQIVTISGEAGLGKSRLLHEFHKWLEAIPEQIWFFEGRASEPMANIPFSLFHDALSFRFEIQDNDPPAVAREKFERGVAAFMGEASSEQAHLIGQLVGFDFSASPHLSGILADSAQIRARAFHEAGQFMRAVATKDASPVAIFLEDIHWADDGSLALLEHIAHACADAPLMAVCLARPSLAERQPNWGEDAALHVSVPLQPLSHADCDALVSELMQKAEIVPEALRDLIVDRAEGNPYYVEELVKMLIDDGVIVASTDSWRVEPSRLAEERVPATLTGVIQARLDSLAPDEKLALQLASVVGRVFWDRAVERVAQGDLPDVDGLIRALAKRDLILKREPSSYAGAKEYGFKNTILHEVTYESVLKRLRRVYHGRAAAWLEQQPGQSAIEHIGLIADHYERAEDAGKALEYLDWAGEKALRTGGNREAIAFFERGLQLASGEYAASLLNAKQWEALLATRVARAYMAVGEHEASARRGEESLALARSIDDRAGVARALTGLAALDHRAGDNERARQRVEECLAIFREIDDETGLIDTLHLLGDILFTDGKHDEANAPYEEAIQLARDIGDRAREAAVMTSYALVPWGQGDPAGALPRLQESLAIFRELGDRGRLANTLNSLGGMTYVLGHYPKALEHYQESLRISEEIGDQNGIARALVNLGETALDMGDRDAAERYTKRGMQASQAIGSIPRVLYALYVLARVKAKSGDPQTAAAWMGLALDHPAARADLRLSCEAFVNQLQAELGQAAFEEAAAQGRALKLRQVVTELLVS